MKSPIFGCLFVLLISHPLVVLSHVNLDDINQVMSNMNHLDDISTVAEAINDLPGHLYTALDKAPGGCGGNWTALSNVTQVMKLIGKTSFTVNSRMVAIDSFGKPGAGILKGHTSYVGSFDQCMQVETSSLDFSMKYCKLGFVIKVKNSTTGNYTGYLPLQFSEALCIPSTCTLDDINDILTNDIDPILRFLHSPIVFETAWPPSFTCTPQGDVPYTAAAKTMIAISCLFVLLVLIGTGYELILWFKLDVLNRRHGFVKSLNILTIEKVDFSETDSLLGRKMQPTFPQRLLTFFHDATIGFSLYKTVPTVLSTRQPPSAITSINGMRVISMFWVILAHAFAFNSQGYSNIFDLVSFTKRFSSQVVMNGFFCVDSFFFLSGVLLAYLTFREMGRRNGKFPFIPYYVHRILRLTPTYMFVLFFYWHLTVHLGSGPTFVNEFGPDSAGAQACHSYWWTNLLYINNIYPLKFGDQCMGWAWYLANDMQFFVIAPLLLIPLYLWFPAGLSAIGVVLLGSFGATGYIAGYYGYPANTFYDMLVGKTVPLELPDQMTEIYGKPYCRISPYLVGILLGYIIYNKYRFTFKRFINLLIHLSLWAVAIILGMTVVYGLYPSWHGHELSAVENVTYYMFSRFVWGLALAIVVFVCHNGYGGVINRFLSMPFWVPLSRMTFNAYLIHEVILFLMYSEFRNLTYYTDMVIALYTIAAVVLAYGTAAVLCVFVEFPLSNLESAVFKLCGAPLRESSRRLEQEKHISNINETTVKI